MSGFRIFIIVFLTLMIQGSSLHAREFLNTFMQLNMGMGYTFASSGDIVRAEDEYYIVDSDGDKVRPENTGASMNLMMDIVPFKPIILGFESHAIKIGLRGGYRYYYVEQKIEGHFGGDKKEYGGNLMNSQSVLIGPLIRYAPSITPSGLDNNYVSGGGFTFYALYGHIFSGEIDAFPAMRARGDLASGVDYQTTIRGYRYDVGVGAEISICSVNLGLNVYYSQVRLKLSKDIYDVGRNTTLHEGNIEIYLGLPFEYFF
jgi:hypothetical protein